MAQGRTVRIIFALRGKICAAGALSLLLACSAIYPESTTPVRQALGDVVLDPPPPEDVYFLYFEKVAVPPKTPGGLEWSGGAPDPFAVLKVGQTEILRTPVAAKTREATWPDQKKENHRIAQGQEIFIEVWDKNPVVDHPICHAKVKDLNYLRDGGDGEIWCDSGARVWLHVEPARAMLGLGLYYESRGAEGVRVTRVAGGSPAERASLSAGDRILAIQGKKVADMDALAIRSLINQHARPGLELDVWFQSGKRHLVKLKEGPIYPLAGDDLKLPQ